MKKFVLTMLALVAMATTSFAQYSDLESMIDNILSQANTSYSVPSVSYSVPTVTYIVPNVTYSVPSVNYNTTTVSGYYRSNGT